MNSAAAHSAVVIAILASSLVRAGDPVTQEMMDAAGGIEEFGPQIEDMLRDRVGTDLAGCTIVEHGFRLNRPTLSFVLTFDTDAFMKDVLARVDRETGGAYTLAQRVMAYVLVFEREDALRTYLGRRVAAALCALEPERSAIGLGYRFYLGIRSGEPQPGADSQFPRSRHPDNEH